MGASACFFFGKSQGLVRNEQILFWHDDEDGEERCGNTWVHVLSEMEANEDICARMTRIAILASGSGTNAQKLVEHFHPSSKAEVVVICCDNPKAGVVQRAWDLNVPSFLFNDRQLKDGSLLRELKGLRVDLVVLAGFLRLIPPEFVRAFPDRIINIHPALLPNYGGKGMYGHHVHEAVLAGKERESGITVHYVNELYDEGEHLLLSLIHI